MTAIALISTSLQLVLGTAFKKIAFKEPFSQKMT